MILRKINLNHFQFLEVVENHKSQCCNFDTKILYIFGRCCRNQGGWNLRMKKTPQGALLQQEPSDDVGSVDVVVMA